jgi:hypothetical protein
MVGVHCCDLTAIITGLVRVLVIHIVRDADFGEYTRMDAHIVGAFLAYSSKLVSKAVPYSCLPNLDSESWGKVFTPQDTKNINIPYAIPRLKLSDIPILCPCRYTNHFFVNNVMPS